jgi:hypothetical protein
MKSILTDEDRQLLRLLEDRDELGLLVGHRFDEHWLLCMEQRGFLQILCPAELRGKLSVHDRWQAHLTARGHRQVAP